MPNLSVFYFKCDSLHSWLRMAWSTNQMPSSCMSWVRGRGPCYTRTLGVPLDSLWPSRTWCVAAPSRVRWQPTSEFQRWLFNSDSKMSLWEVSWALNVFYFSLIRWPGGQSWPLPPSPCRQLSPGTGHKAVLEGTTSIYSQRPQVEEWPGFSAALGYLCLCVYYVKWAC